MDILAELIPYLAARIDAPVKSERPDKAPSKIVVVRRNGGRGDRFVDRPRITIHCWNTTDATTGDLCYEVASAMLEAPDHITNLCLVSQDSIYQNDLDGLHRWTCSFDLVTNR